MAAAPVLIAVILLLLYGDLDSEGLPEAKEREAMLARKAVQDGTDQRNRRLGESNYQTQALEATSSKIKTDGLTSVISLGASAADPSATLSENPDVPPPIIQDFDLDGFHHFAIPKLENPIDHQWLRNTWQLLGAKDVPHVHSGVVIADHERGATDIEHRRIERPEASQLSLSKTASENVIVTESEAVASDRVDDLFVSDDVQSAQTDDMEQVGRAFASAFPANYPIDDELVILAQAVESDGSDAGEERGDGPAGGGEEEYGIPPPRRVPLFLQETSVLLPPGEYQYETGMRYSTNSIVFPVSAILDGSAFVANANQKQQTITMPFEFRFGIAEELQGFVSAPLGWSKQRITFQSVERAEDRVFGIGDVSFGLTKLLWHWKDDQSRLLGSFSASAPTGPSAFAINGQSDIAALGRGYWTVGGGMNLVRTIDPISIFGGVGYTYTFATDVGQGQRLDAGNSLFYSIGLGYSVNPTVSVNVAFAGSYGGELKINGTTLPGSSTEPLSLKIATTFANVKKRTLLQSMANKYTTPTLREPYVRFGLTQFAGDVDFGVRITY
ncbi:MAG: transporter [Rubripirellula sp.]